MTGFIFPGPFRFQDPLWLLVLVPLAVLGVLAVARQRRVAVLYSDTGILRALPASMALRVKRILPWVRLVGLALVILALARPQHGQEEFRVRAEGIAVEMCIDRSGSMRAEDFQVDGERVNRLEAVKRVFHDFVAGNDRLPGRPDDLIGLVAFGGYADARCPLTLDHGALLQVLDAEQIAEEVYDQYGRVVHPQFRKLTRQQLLRLKPALDRLHEESFTAIGDAVALAVERLKNVKAKSKVIVLLSDGRHNAGVVQPSEAADAARSFGIKVYTIGIGGADPAPVSRTDPFGRLLFQSRGFDLDERTLTEIAKATGGQYFNAADTQGLENVYAEIDKLEKSLSEGRLYTEYRELYQYFMFPGVGLVLLEILLASTRFRSLP
ncbi:MAG: VWA domain-containing protein [Planctomycetota bacterium]|jgi:Ca-activated chloride channel family protein